MMKGWGNAAAALVALLWSGCGTIRARTDYDHHAAFGRYLTYTIEGGQVNREWVGDRGNEMVRDRIAFAIAQELSARGLIASREQPDLVVRFVAGARMKWEQVMALTPSYGPYNGGPVWVRDLEEGTLVIDLVDHADDRRVWRSVTTTRRREFGTPELVKKAVAAAFHSYPPGI